MKVAIFSPYATVVPHFDTELDIAQQHLDRGDDVEYIGCHGELANCDFNDDREPGRCEQCRGRREMGLGMLAPRIRAQDFRGSGFLPDKIQTSFDSLETLKSYCLEGFDLGYAALSSLVSICRDPEPDLQEHNELLRRFLESGWQTFVITRQYLKNSRPNRVYVFNGRFSAMRAVFRACEQADIDCFLHERGCDLQHYELVKNHMLHDNDAIDAVIRQVWEQAQANPHREQIGAKWYLDRVARVESNWESFVRDQEKGRLPDDWNAERKNIGIFCSSDDEFVAIGDSWKNDLYENQLTAIRSISEAMRQRDPSIHFTVRMHPNLKGVTNNQKSQMLAIRSPNLDVVAPESDIDTYALMQACDVVVTFGSSMGMEAVFWGKPSILLGPCYYQKLAGPYRASCPAEALELIASDLEAQSRQGALMYGFWLQTRGHPHRYYVAEGLFEGRFKGEVLYARPRRRTLLEKIKNRTQRLLVG
jgi:hypothetical protein